MSEAGALRPQKWERNWRGRLRLQDPWAALEGVWKRDRRSVEAQVRHDALRRRGGPHWRMTVDPPGLPWEWGRFFFVPEMVVVQGGGVWLWRPPSWRTSHQLPLDFPLCLPSCVGIFE